MRSKLVNTTTQTPLKWVRAMRGLGPYAVADPCRLINLHCVQAPLVVGGKRSGIGIAVSLDVAQKHLSHWEANASKVMSADEVLQVASVSLKHKFLASRHTDIAKNVRNGFRPDSKDNSAGSATAEEPITKDVPTKGKKKRKAGGSAKELKLHEACALIPDLYCAKLLQNAVDDEEGTVSQPLADFVMNELVRYVAFCS